ncbi:uncharacterized protein LOC141606339 [Silene latifolia]|uniref:uncharacterized protein LOC141606339 n=1 Tax=Silene latifolia TaxID=37657 RepID=UPI003D789685
MGVMMDTYNVTSKDGYFDFEGDIEKGEVYGNNFMMKELECEGAKNGRLERGNETVIHEDMEISSIDSSSDDQLESVRLVVEKSSRGVGRKVVKEKGKAISAKKHPKPPRPPRGLSLDSADQKLIKELHELARVKRARVERMKALKKAKESRPRSLKNQLFATLLTILFCLVLFFQGISSRTSTTTNIRETQYLSDIAKQHRIISVQQYSVSSVANLNVADSESPRNFSLNL